LSANKIYTLPIIVIAQFFCTSMWFAGNAVMQDLSLNFNLEESALANLTSSVQFGFIIGTLVFAIFNIADRNSPSKVFFISALLGAIPNAMLILDFNTFYSLVFFRFLTGFFLAGIYPVGMKIAADYFEKGLGVSLGYLVGALVLGTAFPHFLKGLSADLNWQSVLIGTSSISFIGGLLIMLFVPNGPYRKQSSSFQFAALYKVFQNQSFRKAAFGYFGHMWELYAFWAFVPFYLSLYNSINTDINLNISVYSFVVIGIGSLSCIIAAYLSKKFGIKTMAAISLSISGTLCLASPLLLLLPQWLFLTFLILWGMAVISDSPLFSTLVANNAQSEIKGTALTIVNSIGFAITILSIQLLSYFQNSVYNNYIFMILALGPILGLIGLFSDKIFKGSTINLT
jgi:MFS family permease